MSDDLFRFYILIFFLIGILFLNRESLQRKKAELTLRSTWTSRLATNLQVDCASFYEQTLCLWLQVRLYKWSLEVPIFKMHCEQFSYAYFIKKIWCFFNQVKNWWNDRLWWRILNFSNHLVHINPTCFLQLTISLLPGLPPSHQNQWTEQSTFFPFSIRCCARSCSGHHSTFSDARICGRWG